jgi:hypothetical protein
MTRSHFGAREVAKATTWLADTALFWGKRVYDFFEVRIAAQRVPERKQF